jgi:outer membrane receptor protein involved in Fe transport
MKRCERWTGVMCLLVALGHLAAMAGTTGKIAGQVSDKTTREPLVGVNVTVQGTMLGGNTDINGYFAILNVPPGTCAVKASLVGYTPTVVTEVRVEIDQTAKVNIELPQQTVDLSEITVIAERKVVRPDVTTSVTSVTNEEVRSLPITTVAGVVGLQAGVQGGLVIRGGGPDEALFLMDGATMRDPRNNQPISGVPLSAVEEISIERGGFNAEYGQLRSGIVNVVTKEGRQKGYSFSVTGRYKPYAAKYSGISPFDPNSMWLRPYLDPAVAWTGTTSGAWDEFTQRQYPDFDGWNAISQRLMSNDDPTDDLSPAGAKRLFEWEHRKRPDTSSPDYDLDLGFGGPVPVVGEQLGGLRFFFSYRGLREMLMIPLTRPDYMENFSSLRLTSNIGSGMKLDVTGTMGMTHNVAINGTEQSSSTDFLRTGDQITANNSQLSFSDSRIFLDSYYSLADVGHQSIAAQLNHVINSKAYYDLRFEYVYRGYDTQPTRMRDTSRRYEIFPGYFASEAPFGFSPNPDPGINGMLMGGHTSTSRDNSKIAGYTFKGDLTAQLDQHNQVKTGLVFAYNDLNIDYGIVNLIFPESNAYVRWHRFPIRLGAYVEDKLEFEGFIANLGLRADYSTLRTEWPDVGVFDRSYFSSNYNAGTPYPMKSSEGEWTLSPRLGISHPISENSKLFFNYGHFRQLSTYEQMLRQSRGAHGELKTLGDPSLTSAKTIAYELGYDHSLFEQYLLQVSAFYRDISDVQDFQTYTNARGDVIYQKATANSYQDVRGFEVTVRKMTGQWWNGFVNYTYPVTSGGHFDKSFIYEDPSAQLEYDRRTSDAYQYKPTPRPYARLSLGLFTPDDLGNAEAMKLLLGGWNITLLGDWLAGDYVTWNPNQVQLGAPNLKMVDWYNLNLRFTKSIPLGPVRVMLFVDVQNVFNTKRLNLNSFYNPDDFKDYFGSLHLPQSPAWTNIPGDDKAGDYRKDGVDFQPVVQANDVTTLTSPSARAIYYERASGRYMNYVNGSWTEVDKVRLQKVLDDKAYIDMPNESSFWFLNPRNVFFGITTTIDL